MILCIPSALVGLSYRKEYKIQEPERQLAKGITVEGYRHFIHCFFAAGFISNPGKDTKTPTLPCEYAQKWLLPTHSATSTLILSEQLSFNRRG